MKKTDILALILSIIMKNNNIPNAEYVIISGYALREVREVTDLDVAVSKKAYKILKKSKIFQMGKSKINNNERLFLDLSHLGENAEIEIFEVENHGFPDDRFTVRNIHKNKYIILDPFGNPYLNAKGASNLYGDAKLIDNKIIIGDDIEINKERLIKNITQLKLLLKIYPKEIKYIKNKIEKQEKILEKIK
jgi:hypothetical protein